MLHFSIILQVHRQNQWYRLPNISKLGNLFLLPVHVISLLNWIWFCDFKLSYWSLCKNVPYKASNPSIMYYDLETCHDILNIFKLDVVQIWHDHLASHDQFFIFQKNKILFSLLICDLSPTVYCVVFGYPQSGQYVNIKNLRVTCQVHWNNILLFQTLRSQTLI